jgi:lipopolysaccharide transport protein LptA
MKKQTLLSISLLFFAMSILRAQTSASAELFSPAPKKEAEKNSSPAKSQGIPDLANPDQPITTEITADQAFFDSAKNVGTFTGHVVVTDPRFHIQSDKLVAYISKSENQGLEKAVADGNVGVVRDRPDPKGGPPTRSVGRSEHAVYTTSDGNVELSGAPRVQQGMNMHIATADDTVMILNQAGQLTTHGPSRTEIHQEPKTETKPEGSAKPEASPKP